MLPFYLLTDPPAARALLMYRYHTLEAATTPLAAVAPDGRVIPILTGEQEHHISADIAYAVWQYWRATETTTLWSTVVPTFWCLTRSGPSSSDPHPALPRSEPCQRPLERRFNPPSQGPHTENPLKTAIRGPCNHWIFRAFLACSRTCRIFDFGIG